MYRPSPRSGFTLIELLVVIAILALLVSILMPMMAKAKDIARRVMCGTSMKSIGGAAMVFAGEHRGRGPGHANRGVPSPSSIAWQNILNQEYYKNSMIPRRVGTYVKNTLCCASLTSWRGGAPAAFAWNLNAAGGPNWGAGSTLAGPYGLMMPAAQMQHAWNTPPEGCILSTDPTNGYSLGAILDQFKNTGHKFLMVDNERANDYFFTGDSNPPTGRYTLQLGGATSDTEYGQYPPWSGAGGTIAFRHVLPRVNSTAFAGLTAAYQTQATGNFLFVDTHVESLTPMARIQKTDRSSYP